MEVVITNSIERRRRDLGLTQAALAEKLNVSQSAVSMYETGERTPPIPMLIKLADVLQCTTDELLDRKEA